MTPAISSNVCFLRRAGWLAMLCTACIGCGQGGGLDKVVVDGSVTIDGNPVPNGEIRFYPIQGTPGSVSGGPIKDGRYTAKSRGGVPAGKHRVEIRAFRSSTRPGKGDIAVEGGPAVQYLPAGFNDRSELTVTIQADGSNATQDFTLSIKETK